LKTLIPRPASQHLFLEYLSPENNNRQYYLDTISMQSQWAQPDKFDQEGKESVVMNGIAVNEQMVAWIAQN
jgi:hypothetical protein